MWSGQTLWRAPPSLSRPCTVITFEPIPSTWAPISTSSRARSWTWGSEAALAIVVGPGVSAAASSAFSVPITEGSSMKMRVALRPAAGAPSSIQLSPPTVAPRSRKASRWASRRRRPIVSPPGGGILASPKRASSGPAARNDARMRLAGPSSTEWASSTASACRRTWFSPVHSTLTPRPFRRSSIESTSLIRGTLSISSSSSVKRQAARIGSAAFLFPAATISPDRGAPPWITNFSIVRARVPRAMADPSRDDAWQLVCEWVESDSLRKHLLGRRGDHAGVRPQVG